MAIPPPVTDMEALAARPAIALLREQLPEAISAARLDRDELTVWIEAAQLIPALRLLRDAPSTGFAVLADLTALDWYPATPRFEVVYSLLSQQRRERLRVKVRLEGEAPSIASVTPLWAGASPFEREVFDLFGIGFENHPDLRRILLPDDWEGYPLRKDYPVEGPR